MALLLAGGFPVLIAVWIIASGPAGEPLWAALVVAAFGLPASVLGGYLVRHALKEERQAVAGRRGSG